MTDTGASSVTLKARYGGVARFFHWSIAGLIVLQYVLAKLGEVAEDDGERLRALALLANHKSVGMTVLALAVLRVSWRFVKTPPRLPESMPNWQQTASHVSHWSLYAFIFAMPISGWLLSSAAAYSVSWFGVFTWPDLIEPSKAWRSAMHSTHDILGKLLFAVAVLHIVAACKHHFLDRDDVLRRMSSAVSYSLFAVVIVAGVVTLARVGGSKPAVAADPAPAAVAEPVSSDAIAAEPAVADGDLVMTQPEATPEPEVVAETVEATAAAPEPVTAEPAPVIDPEPPAPPPAPEWRIDLAASSIAFTAEQAGAPFTGRWTDWSADMRFAADALETSGFDVAIRVAGVDTRDGDRDSTLQDAEFFNAERFPEVRFVTGAIRAEGAGFVADSTLVVKGIEHPVTFTFNVVADGAARTLTGTSRLDRLALGVGTGEWADTEWVGQFVDVEVEVRATIDGD
ncbi:MAG: cytochrome b/b6 domain-containing protein [Pseudomonadota bacterium]